MIESDIPRTPEEIRCPNCADQNFVKNGVVRGTQRYRCKACNINFSTEFKNRWPNDSKLINLMLYRSGMSLRDLSDDGGATPQAVDRWLSEAKEHHLWFVRAIAEHVLYSFEDRQQTVEDALSGGMGLYGFITERDPDRASGEFVDKLVVQLGTIGSQRFVDALMAFLESLPGNRKEGAE
jgi:hypothetical protein